MSDNHETFSYQQFLRDSAERQQMIFSCFGDREFDGIPKNRPDLIRTKVSWYLFNKDYGDLIETSTKEEKGTVDNAINKLVEFSGDGKHLLLGCFYVDILLKKESTVAIIPILKTKRSTDETIVLYEAHSGRVYYGGWETYERENKLPPCWMCYPQGGIYRSHSYEESRGRRVLLECCESPSCHTILPTLDVIVNASGGFCAAALASSVFFPPLLACGTVAGAGVIIYGIYGVTRGIYELYDRNQHKQSCSVSDPDAFREWLNIILSGGSALMVGGSVGIRAAAPNYIHLRLVDTLIRCVSIGVNVLGIVAIFIDLCIKFLCNGLELTDLKRFVSLCLLISNIVISTDQAERIIQFMANQPQRLRNTFNMVRNTTRTIVKGIRDNVPWLEALNIVTGDMGMNILRNVGFKRTAEAITFVRNRIKRCIRERSDIAIVLTEILQHCYLFFTEILLEVKEACSKVEKWFGNALYYISIENNRVFENSSSVLALDITDEVERVLDDVEILEDTVRDDSAKNIINFVNNVANEAHCETDVEYVKIIELISDKLRNVCNTELLVRQLKPTEYLTDQSKGDVLGKIVLDLEQSSKKKEIVDIFQKQKYFSRIKPSVALWKPIYQTANNSVYFFEMSSKDFNQFVYDSTCELFEAEDIFTNNCEFFLHANDTIFCVRDGDKSLIFNYDIESSRGKIKGIVILDV